MTSEFIVAVHALVYLNYRKKTLSSDELADNVCTNPARIRKVMAKLKKAGFVSAKEGKTGGGYCLEKNAEAINLCQVFHAVEERVIHTAWHSGDAKMECLVSSGMAGIMEDIYDEMDEMCKDRLSKITIQDIYRKLFENK